MNSFFYLLASPCTSILTTTTATRGYGRGIHLHIALSQISWLLSDVLHVIGCEAVLKFDGFDVWMHQTRHKQRRSSKTTFEILFYELSSKTAPKKPILKTGPRLVLKSTWKETSRENFFRYHDLEICFLCTKSPAMKNNVLIFLGCIHELVHNFFRNFLLFNGLSPRYAGGFSRRLTAWLRADLFAAQPETLQLQI